MSDFKSKLPDLKELSSMTSKLFNGIKNSVVEIVKDYKEKRANDEAQAKPAATETTTETVKKTKATATPKETTVSSTEEQTTTVTTTEAPEAPVEEKEPKE